MTSRHPIRWKLGALAGLAVVLVTSVPQITLWAERGRDWQGAYALTDPDELVYSAYLNSIIQGRPRRNDPFLASQGAPLAASRETYFSIQFFPPYAVAFVARILGLSASTAFILLVPFTAFVSSLAVFWLLAEVTGDDKLAAIGVLIILLCGILASTNLITTENNYAVFSFLRRYIPAVPFPLFFIFCVLVWRAFTRPGSKAVWWAGAAGGIFSLLVYSYFFLWTAAGAWLLCFTVLWLIVCREERTHIIKSVAVMGVIMVAALLPYFYLLSLRAQTTDSDQALVLTRAPDLFRFIEILGAVIISALALGARKGKVSWRSPAVLFAAACAITPFVVFNQQVVTGRSLQPFHYEQFVLNYLILASALIADALLWKFVLKRPALSLALPLVVGLTIAFKTSNVNSQQNLMRDEAMPLFERLEGEAASSGSSSAALFDRTLLAASAPTSCSSLPLLWSPYTYTYGTISTAEDDERLFQYFYYLGVDEPKLEKMLGGRVFRAALFGLPRVNSTLTEDFRPVSTEEIRAQIQAYGAYAKSFSRDRAQRWPLSYVVVSKKLAYDFSNLDQWYERDGGEPIESSLVYRVRLRADHSD